MYMYIAYILNLIRCTLIFVYYSNVVGEVDNISI